MREFAAVLLLTAVTAGCATEPTDYYGAGSEPAAQALAKCRAQSDMLLASPNAAANPFFIAAAQQQYVNDCMAAAGYSLR